MGQIIRTCSALTGAALVIGTASASAPVPAISPLKSYAAGRMADINGDSAVAAIAYSRVLLASPNDYELAQRAYREAINAGDWVHAMAAARTLQGQKTLPADVALLLFSERIARRDWGGAQLALATLDPRNGLGFLIPVLRAWTQFGAGAGDPLATLAISDKESLIISYAAEHRALMLLALGRTDEGIAAVKAVVTPDARGTALRLAAAAQLWAKRNKAAALDVLAGNDSAIAAARKLVEAGKPIGGAVDQPAKGIATLISRVASDLMRDRATPAAVMLARLASFSDPDDEQVRLILAQALLANGRIDVALATITQIKPGSIYAEAFEELYIETLQQSGRDDEALVIAKQAVARGDATVNQQLLLGQSYARLNRFEDAANAYHAAIKHVEEGKAEQAGGSSRLWLLYGGALDAAKDWVRAKPALQRAVELDPGQAAALNHLGYAMLEHGENLEEAARLIAKASALRPQDPAIADSLGWAFFKRGQTGSAITILEDAVAIDPTIAETSEHLGDAYWTAGRRIDARYTWRAALVQAADDETVGRLNRKIANGLNGARE